MGRAGVRAAGTLVALMLAAQLTGCESVRRYFRDRGRDATDIIDVKYGLGGGVGAKVQITPFVGSGFGLGGSERGWDKWGREWQDCRGMKLHLGLCGIEDYPGLKPGQFNILGVNLPQPEPLLRNPHHFARFGADLYLPGGIFGIYLNAGELADFGLGIFGVDFVGNDEALEPPKPFSDRSEPVFFPELDAGGVFFVIDGSSSWVWDGVLEYARRMVPRVLDDLSSDDLFGIICYGQQLLEFRAGEPAPADRKTKSSAILFLEAVDQGSGSCPEKTLHAALNLVEASDVERNVIVYIGDGGGTCEWEREDEYLEQTLASVTNRNAGRARIITIQVGETGKIQMSFLRRLAGENRGCYHQVFAPERPRGR